MVNSKTLWRILSEHGKRVGVINVPMSTSEDLNGFIIPGFLSRNEGIPYPVEVQKKLERRFGYSKVVGDVETAVLERVKEDPNLFFQRVEAITDELSEISLFLFEEEAWDFFMVVFMGTDRIQHFFWKYVDDTHPEYEKNMYTERVKHYYKKLDQIIARFLRVTPTDTMVILLSDHGFCPIHSEVFINNYLHEHGMVKLTEGKLKPETSSAISYGYGDIWLNVQGREPKGTIQLGREYAQVREEIIRILENLRIKDEKPIKKV